MALYATAAVGLVLAVAFALWAWRRQQSKDTSGPGRNPGRQHNRPA